MSQGPAFSSTFEFRHYARILSLNWHIVILIALASGITALTFTVISSAKYTASADVALLNVRSQVIFDPAFTTIPEDKSAYIADPETRSKALAELAMNKSLLTRIYGQLSEEDKRKYSFNDFLDKVAIENTGDLLRFSVSWYNPNGAATSANSWAEQYVVLANHSYISSAQTIAEAESAVERSFEKYANSQRNFEQFIKESELNDLRREVGEIDILLDDLEKQKADALRLLTGTYFLAASHIAQLTRDAYLAHMDYAVQRQVEYQQQQLDTWYRRLSALQLQENRYSDLHKQLESSPQTPSAATGDALALVFARSGLNQNADLPELQLQMNIEQLVSSENITTHVRADDIQSLLNINQDGQVQANWEIVRLSQDLLNGSIFNVPANISEESSVLTTIRDEVENVFQIRPSMAVAEEEINAKPLSLSIFEFSEQRKQLLARVEALEAKEKELRHIRDTDWELFVTLDNKAQEVEAQSSLGAPQVRLAIPAQPPIGPDDKYIGRIALFAVITGLIFGLVFVVFWDTWQAAKEQS